jgi:cyclopropane-fatty-acyl-phospholipid synthase
MRESKTLSERLVRKVLSQLEHGCLRIHDGASVQEYGNPGAELVGEIMVQSPHFYDSVLRGGSLGAGEAWMRGEWTSPDLTAVVRVMARNLEVLTAIRSRFAWVAKPIERLRHWTRRNTAIGAQRNIEAHYDLGNEFYQLWLDPAMVYSSAIYPDPQASLEVAQQHKLELICQRLDLRPGQRVMEVGTGWGALAMHMAKHHDVEVVTTTISQAQYELASARIETAGLSDRITLLKQDYRSLEGHYDRVVSIEMIEAVGHAYMGTFFRKLGQLLKPDGRLLVQAITIPDQRYAGYRRSVDFIQRYIFPGGFLPSLGEMSRQLGAQTNLMWWSLDDLGQDYARTLRHWHDNFDAAVATVRDMGYSESFVNMWKYYLSYCEGGFIERSISACHLVAVGPEWRPSAIEA